MTKFNVKANVVKNSKKLKQLPALLNEAEWRKWVVGGLGVEEATIGGIGLNVDGSN
jgi:hypothetical protein